MYHSTIFPERIQIPKEKINFSLLIPTRNRESQLDLLLESIMNLTLDITKIEFMFCLDTDDIDSIRTIKKFIEEYTDLNILLLKSDKGESCVYHYMNRLGYLARGKYIIVTNDDTMFGSPEWDINCYNRLEEYIKDKKDGIVLGIVEDKETGKRIGNDGNIVTDFPVISKKGIETLGFVLDPHYWSSTSDWDICHLYFKANRCIDLRDILIIHHHPTSEDIQKYRNLYIKDAKIDRNIIGGRLVKAPIIDSMFNNGKDIRVELLQKYITEQNK